MPRRAYKKRISPLAHRFFQHLRQVIMTEAEYDLGLSILGEQDVGRVVPEIDGLSWNFFEPHDAMRFDQRVAIAQRNLFNGRYFHKLKTERTYECLALGGAVQIVLSGHPLDFAVRIGAHKGVADEGREQVRPKGVVGPVEVGKKSIGAIADGVHGEGPCRFGCQSASRRP
jgi:hypothetical protein